MRRRIICVLIISIFLISLFFNMYLETEYDINIFEFLKKSEDLTQEERDWLSQHGKIIYGSDDHSPPLRYIDEKNGQYSGLILDYIRALSIELGTEIEYKPLGWWNQSLKALSNKQVDCSDLIPSEERGELYDFSDPIYNLSGVIAVPIDENKIVSYEDLEGKNIAVPKGDYAIGFLDSKLNNVNYIFTPNLESAITHLINGQVDAVVGDEPVLTYLINDKYLKNNFKILDNPMYQEDCVLAVPKSEKILLSILNKGIFNLKKKKTMFKIQQKWFGIAAPFAKENASDKISLLMVIFISIIFLVTYLAYSWNNVLKKEVEKRTKELSVSKNRLQTTFDSLTHLMIVVDRDHNIVNVNDAFCRLLRLDKDEILGRNCLEFKDILYGHGVEYIIENTFYTGKQYQQELKYQDKIFNINTFPLDDSSSEFSNILIMVKDITQLRLSESQILQKNKMAAVGQLAAGVAHEIRNPLGLIRNYSYILKNNLYDDEKVKKSINIIEDSVEKSSNIIDNLLNFSRISSDRCEKINLRRFITKIIDLEKKTLEKNNIDYKIVCSKDIICCTSQESLKHIFVNLISNSIDALPNGGLIRIQCNKNDGMLSIKFSDNGTGISEENLENIFNPFFTTKQVGKGTGLGLYITYNEVQKYGGAIRVKSKFGTGTVFHIKLPLRGNEDDQIK